MLCSFYLPDKALMMSLVMACVVSPSMMFVTFLRDTSFAFFMAELADSTIGCSFIGF